MNTDYLFTSNRLGFRNWVDTDVEKMILINSDKEVMKFFPFLPTEQQTRDFIMRMQKQFAHKGYCYFATDLLETNTFLGFIGLSEQTYKASFTPCTDIGWRLSKDYWSRGFATEGAKACLEYADKNLNLPQIFAIASQINKNSIKVMDKIGMRYLRNFEHPSLIENPRLKNCVVYSKHLE